MDVFQQPGDYCPCVVEGGARPYGLSGQWTGNGKEMPYVHVVVLNFSFGASAYLELNTESRAVRALFTFSSVPMLCSYMINL